MTSSNQQTAMIDATRQWIDTVIVKYNFCPFARKELQANTIAYRVIDSTSFTAIADRLYQECLYLDNHPDTATTLLILADGFADFDHYLDLVDCVQSQIIDPQYEGIYQLASFHPDYCFADSDIDDAANYTNRAPYPTIHLLREADISQALEGYPDPEQIPERNIALARRKGKQTLAQLLVACRQDQSLSQ